MEDLAEAFPLLSEARASIAQGEFEHGIGIYSEILEGVNPDDEKVPYLYIEYADALIKSSDMFFIEEISKISGRKGLNLEERKGAEDDLEIAWNLLEICKNAFNILKDYSMLARTRFLQGEICLLNNEFRDALHELVECVAVMDKIYEKDCFKYADVYLSLANCYEFLQDFERSKEYYDKTIGIYRAEQEQKESEEEKNEISDVITGLLQKATELKYKKEKLENVDLPDEPESDDVFIDINACKRNKK
ncbi:putative histone-binding protein N1/N2 [Encephalitozoon intestinalis ATCC 50506]|uniref:Histone-binding protein N1/N2 n=1 Tax=Encephalitozoon intestinalis (strain ATCC 50506) TaxID=876142 RepID=E0S756_ENCIT|nr:putative histone-binding protein N1/N2 [Encephalitozoon intestinalis ATCC 50506]ADM11484.1 putative histone-binding protein N1/N2 [Encephalitozoon intestinalis ATCC 50506]UTX45196.1 PINS LGN-like protein [Encephalitozoon intestinalis]